MNKKKEIKTKNIIDGDDIASSFEDSPDAWTEVPLEEQDLLRKRLKPNREKRISIRVSVDVLQKIQEVADSEGLPYQTLINSYLHKLATSKSDLSELKEAVRNLEEEIKEIKKKIA